MLLCIALANSHYFLNADQVFAGFPVTGSWLDRGVGGFLAAFVDGRAYPMFALLFGYGLARILDRQERAGVEWRQARKLLRRRSLFLIGLGFLHATLLYIGDILAAYGVLSFLLVRLLRWKDRTLLILAVVGFAIGAVPTGGSLSTSTDPPDPTMLPPALIEGIVHRATIHPILAPLEAIGLFVPFLLGIWAGRRRVLEQPERYLRGLRVIAAAGISVAVLGGLPVALVVAGVVDRPGAGLLGVLGTLHDSTGHFGGLGYAALIALLAVRIGGRGSSVVRAIAAVGQRSLTCYLCQSVVWTLAFAPFAGDLSRRIGTAATAALAVGTWLLTVLLAEIMRRHNHRGPFEVLLRRVAYGRRSA
ncbi:DUF418 domain-containing protein [Flindersiella endophytica]